MVQDFLKIMLRTFTGLLVSLALSSGMTIGENTGTFTPPPPGSHDSPIPPEDFLKGSGDFPPLDTNQLPVHDNHPMTQFGSPQSRGGYLPPVYDYQPILLDYPPQAERSHSGLRVPDMFQGPPLSPAEEPLVPWPCYICKVNNTKGDRGDRGLPGSPGSPGRRGLTGPQGLPGFSGLPGMKGQKGDDGTKGDQGPVGFMGLKGDRGFKGDKGDMGINGKTGDPGPPGEPGQCPASCESTRGSPGEAGLPGAVGPRGLPGVAGNPGFKGQKGDKGEIGMQGLKGVGGQKGDQGEQGLCNCKDGAKGATGDLGPVGSKGEKGDAGHQGPTGVGGLKGERGDTGMRGIQGPCSPAIQSAFSARLGNIYPRPDLPVPFSLVIYNLQFHFDPFAGIYRAPVNGTYIFSYNLVVFDRALKVGLFHNFVPVVKSTELVSLSTVSQQVVLHLNMGDEVWLQVKDTASNGMFATSETSSTFSGFLLYPDSCEIPFSREFPDPVVGTYSWGDLDIQLTPAPKTHSAGP